MQKAPPAAIYQELYNFFVYIKFHAKPVNININILKKFKKLSTLTPYI